jgi:hypothetical protein
MFALMQFRCVRVRGQRTSPANAQTSRPYDNAVGPKQRVWLYVEPRATRDRRVMIRRTRATVTFSSRGSRDRSHDDAVSTTRIAHRCGKRASGSSLVEARPLFLDYPRANVHSFPSSGAHRLRTFNMLEIPLCECFDGTAGSLQVLAEAYNPDVGPSLSGTHRTQHDVANAADSATTFMRRDFQPMGHLL